MWGGGRDNAFSPPAPPSGGGASLLHGQPLVVTGNGFGTKSRGLATMLRDTQTNGIGTVDPQWWTFHPKSSNPADAANVMQIQPIGYDPWSQGIGSPHPFVGGIYAGTNYMPSDLSRTTNNSNYECYLAWQFSLPSTIQSGDTCCLYMRWYERNDPSTPLPATVAQGGNNNKLLGYGPGGYADSAGAETSPESCIVVIQNGAGPNNNTDDHYALSWQDNLNSGGTIPGGTVLEFPDRNGHSHFFGGRANSYKPSWGWLQMELEMCIDTNTGAAGNGYFRYIVNGQESLHAPNTSPAGAVISYAGRTDNFMSISPTIRTVNIGCGMYNNATPDPHTISYYSDVYADLSAGGVKQRVARAVIGDAPTYAASAIRSPLDFRIPGALWSPTQIIGGLWKDKFVTGQNAYVHVVTESLGVLDNVMGTMIWT